jgi:hypothetical protein
MNVLSVRGFLLPKAHSTHTAGTHPDTSGVRGAVESLFQRHRKMRISKRLADITFAYDVRHHEISKPLTSLKPT